SALLCVAIDDLALILRRVLLVLGGHANVLSGPDGSPRRVFRNPRSELGQRALPSQTECQCACPLSGTWCSAEATRGRSRMSLTKRDRINRSVSGTTIPPKRFADAIAGALRREY